MNRRNHVLYSKSPLNAAPHNVALVLSCSIRIPLLYWYLLYRIRQINFLKMLLENALKIKTTEYFLNFLFFYLKVQSFRLIMENNFIQMAASAGHAVVYTIGPIFKHIIDCVQLYFICILFWCLAYGSNPDFTSNKPTHCLLNYSDFQEHFLFIVIFKIPFQNPWKFIKNTFIFFFLNWY